MGESLLGEGDQLFQFPVEILEPFIVWVTRQSAFDLLELDLIGFEVRFVHLELDRVRFRKQGLQMEGWVCMWIGVGDPERR